MNEYGYVILDSKKLKKQFIAIVVVLKTENSYKFCPVWKEGVNKLVPIMRATKNNTYGVPEEKFYIDIGDLFAYELWTNKTLEDRIIEFNAEQQRQENEGVAIVKIATVGDLKRAGIPYYVEGQQCESIAIVK